MAGQARDFIDFRARNSVDAAEQHGAIDFEVTSSRDRKVGKVPTRIGARLASGNKQDNGRRT